MLRGRGRGWIAGAATVGILVIAVLAFGPTPPAGSLSGQERAPSAVAAKPIPMPTNLIAVEITLGLKDEKRTAWDGSVDVSAGRVQGLELVRNAADGTVNGNQFKAHTIRRMMMMRQVILQPVLRAILESPPSGRVTVTTKNGKFEFTLADLPSSGSKSFLDGQVAVERQDAPIRLTGRETEDDYPVAVKGADNHVWVAYIAYQPGAPIVSERLDAGDFETLVPKGNGDQLRLLHFNGKEWLPPIDITAPGLNIWRPTIAIDGKGVVTVAWSQQVNGNWDIYYRHYTPAKEGPGQWGEPMRLTNDPGADFHVVAATDSHGVVWLAWQGWRKDNFEILLCALADGHPWKEPRIISTSKANDWGPAIAADKQGNVYVAYDTYDKGNYDVRLFIMGKESKTIDIANSARFEARPSLACDAADRLWIAYEDGDEQWGKDYANATPEKIPVKNRGFALYIHRTVQVKCLVNGKLMHTGDDLQQAMESGRLIWNRSVPRLTLDTDGGLWLFVRHHPPPNKQGEVWDSYGLRYDGKKWSAPRHLAASANIMDNRPALVPYGSGLLAVHSSDNRIRTINRDQNDLFASLISSTGKVTEPQLVAAAAPAPPQLPQAHPQEPEEVARLRAYRIKIGNKEYRPFRGEFHRHTELSSHNDQDGLLEDQWRYALDAGGLDWMGNGDHDNGFGVEYYWWMVQKISDIMIHPPYFVSAMTYERSVVYPNGHRNIIMPRRGIRPLPRYTKGLPGTPEKGSEDTKRVYGLLRHFGGICASHTSATDMGTDWRDNDPLVEPIVEIYQGHRHDYERPDAPRAATQATQIGGFRPAGFVLNAFDKGYRLGFESSSDHVSTHLSYSVVLVEQTSRQGIIDALKKRHSYAASDNIVLDVRSGEHLMGDEFETAQHPVLDIYVHGTTPIAKVSIIRDNKYIYVTEPKKAEVKLQYTDMDAQKGKPSFYYVRVEQADSNLAWASPMWITYNPK